MESLADFFSSRPKTIFSQTDDDFSFTDVILFGCGERGAAALRTMTAAGVNCRFFVDNDPQKHGAVFNELEIRHPKEVFSSPFPVCVCSAWSGEITTALREGGYVEPIYQFVDEPPFFNRSNLEKYGTRLMAVYESLSDDASKEIYLQSIAFHTAHGGRLPILSDYPQYMHPAVLPKKNDVILDIGGMWGETAVMFLEHIDHEGHVYCFEPSERNHAQLIRTIQRKDLSEKIIPVKKGCWSNSTTLRFNSDFPECHGSHRISDEGNETIEVVAIDAFCKERNIAPTLIKMDIEGAEVEAIAGARKTILANKPRLQLCVYHEVTHLFEVQEEVNSIVDGYTWFLGHHSSLHTETVLYGVHESD